MHTWQPKSHNQDTAPAQAAETPQKAAVSAASASHVPAWAGGMNDLIPNGLVLQGASTIPGIQAKLAISQPNDPYEQEADRVAEHVMRMPASPATVQRKCACGGIAGPTGECEACAAKRKALQRRATQPATGSTAPLAVNQVLSSGNGRPLDAGTRALMEPRFGTDFSQVRVHTDGQAAESARSVNALAYTVGSDVVFGKGQYRPERGEGQKLLAHELTHVVQQNAIGANFGPLMLQRQPAPTAPCTVGDPKNCPTYEEWIHEFRKLPTFPASDMAPAGVRGLGFDVLGDKPAREVRPGNDPAPDPDRKLPPPPATGERNYEHFIDHPTDAWVTKNLPPELRATAYILPVDCADLAAVLRHVWLFYHKRTERYGKWVLGLGVSHADIQKLIVWDLSAYNVKKIVNMYSDSAGRPILSFGALKKLLHPGDILVWEHHKNAANGPLIGGHTQTVEHVKRDDKGDATSLTLLQGNEPIFKDQAEAIKKKLGGAVPDVGTMRDAPGRRIERDELSGEDLHDEGAIWTQIGKTVDDKGNLVKEFTILVAAGPAASAIRPAKGKSVGTLGQLSDWLPLLRKATQGNLEATFEAALEATRAMIEGGQQAVTEQDAVTLGSIVGERLRMLARLSQAGHGGGFDALKTLQRLHAVVRALGGLGLAIGSAVQVQDTTLKRIFERIDVALESVEETRLIPSLSSPFGTTSAPGNIIMGAGFSQLLIPFGAALNAASTLMAAQTVMRDFGQKLWQLATARAQAGKSPDTDDRPLYWTRLLMMHALRMWQPGFPIDFGQRQDLLDLFERASRGMESVSFSGAAGVKKILISGFDPFGFDAKNINTGNPSGAVALALNGRTITRGGITAEVQSVIFPVRFADFDERKVETFFRPHLTGPDRVDMIMTISQGDTEFKVEEWAGRRRSSGSFADNAGRIGGGSPEAPVVPAGLPKGPEFIRTALPEQAIRAELGRTGPIAAETEFIDIPGKHTDKSQMDPTKRRSIAVEGSGGGFLSNEIFYRASLLRLQTHATIPVGHLHVPIAVDKQSGLAGASSPWTRDAIVNQVQRILEATLPKL